MSELTRCNFCGLRDIKARAKKAGKKVTVLCDAFWGLGGYNVYVHPKDVDVAKMSGGEDGDRKGYRAAWMQEIGKRCSC